MPIAFDCPSCAAKIKAPEAAVGKTLSCPKCGGRVRVPVPKMSAPIPFAEPSPLPATPREAVVGRPRESAPHRREPEDDPPRRGRAIEHPPTPASSSAALGLGISSMVLGVVALPSGAIPCCGHVVAFPVGGIGLLLGIGAVTASLCQKGRSIGFPIAGLVMNIAGLCVAGVWLSVAHDVASDLNKSAEKAREERARSDEWDREAKRIADAESKRRADEAREKARWLDPLNLAVDQTGEFHPDTPWEYRRLMTPGVAVVGHEKDDLLAVVVESSKVLWKPNTTDGPNRPVYMPGRWRVVRREKFDVYTVFAIEQVK